jgi:FKBP-type peptidyl-prolyl cis-trans isomerase 2
MQKGDFLRIDYIGRVVLTGEIFDLTDEAVARKEGIHDPKQSYGPQLVILGSGMTVPGLEKQLMEMKPGEEREVDIPFTEAFGKRDPRLIKIVSLHRFISQKMNPVPGAYVNINGRNAKVQSVSGGRVRVDFNSPLAGKDLHYKVKITNHITDLQEKSQALLDHYDIGAKAAVKEKSLTVSTKEKLPDQVRQLINTQLKKWLPELKGITYVTPSKGKADKVLKDGKVVGKSAKPEPDEKKEPAGKAGAPASE